ncbi:GYDIA family GHMP kinase [Nonlabens marinus]|uniref:Mevalonate kinase n=1 Tax=Nonlabens marinus S1-08 TaxID=1454201 RepID=W8VQ45_9FLAO|nr:GYDIA family GHMP kinase [Nonlabens marinus]BAO55444.1 hypothetical protein NMS_1435 [Nonlabens marinus S1-08]
MAIAGDLFEVTKAQFSAHGKFLLTGEYAVLDNVDALAMPLKLDQRLIIQPRDDQQVVWKSYNADGSLWLDVQFSIADLRNDSFDHVNPVFKKLLQILKSALQLSNYTNFYNGFDAVTQLDFDRKSGMGTSSTLIAMIADWVGCDAYKLQFESFGGSGYDIACARATSPIIYNYNETEPLVQAISYEPEFTDQLFFIYLNQKQNSRESIARFNTEKLTTEIRQQLNEMPKRFLETENDLQAFENVIYEHESIVAGLIGAKPIKERFFPDYQGAVKSLGGWGGDYMLVTGTDNSLNYFKGKGYHQILNWEEVALG